MKGRIIVKMDGMFDIKECVLEFIFYDVKKNKKGSKGQELDIWITAKLIEPISLDTDDNENEIITNELKFNIIYSIVKNKIIGYCTHFDYIPISREVINMSSDIKTLYINLKNDIEKICKKEKIDYKNFLITFFNFIFMYPDYEESFCLNELERIYEMS